MINMAQEVRQQVSLADVLDHYGFRPNRSGFLHCPFHSGDRDASLKIYPAQNSWHCFGCGKGGSVIDFVMEMEKIGFVDALRWFNEHFFLGLDEEKPSLRRLRQQEEARRQKEQQETKRKAKMMQLLHRRRAIWQQIKATHPQSHEDAQQMACAMAELEYLDYQIERMADII